MALAKKCDRCGKFYEHYPNEDRSDICNGVRLAQCDFTGKLAVDNPVIDLCPRCMDGLKHYLKNYVEEEMIKHD